MPVTQNYRHLAEPCFVVLLYKWPKAEPPVGLYMANRQKGNEKIMCHVSHVTCEMSHATCPCPMSHFMCRMSPVPCH